MKTYGSVLFAVFAFFLTPVPAADDFQKVDMPEPLQLKLDLRTTSDYIPLVMDSMGYELQPREENESRFLTKEEVEFSGVSAMTDLKKIAIVVTDYTTSFYKGKYYLEITVSFLKPRLTAISALAHIQGLRRSIDGTEEWVPLQSNGIMETRFLNELSIAVTGKRAYDKKMPYWKKSSQEINIKK
ncbi:MAG: hypothetical protein JXQ27_09720 [Acidobacteria bacterium]|nr:hypothetical protein [Acidobacteriota bacterium]